MRTPRAALAAVLLLSGCASPAGVEVEECNTSWRGLEGRIVTGADGDQRTIPVACMWRVGEKRISIGFELPPGPDCYELAAIDLVESADAVSITLHASVMDDLGGACPSEPIRTVTEVDLQSPVAGRRLLDGSQ